MIAPQDLTEVAPVEQAGACRWPAERFYWAVLDVPLRRPGVLPAALLVDLQEQLPLDVRQLHAVGAQMKSDVVGAPARTLVCAALRDEVCALPASFAKLTPCTAPAGFESAADLSSLNLLVAEFEPFAQRRRRALRHVAGMVGAVVLALLISLGLSRRTRVLDREYAAHVAAASGLDLSKADLAVLRAFAARANSEPVPSDATGSLAAVLRAWPSATTGAVAEVQTLSVDGKRAALTVSVSGDPVRFLAAVRTPPGHVLDQPGLGTTPEGKVRLALTFSRLPELPVPDTNGGLRP